MPDREPSIRHHLTRVREAQLPRPEFTDWFVAASWGVDPLHDRGASDLTYAIELALAERSDGVLTPDELQAALRDLARRQPLTA